MSVYSLGDNNLRSSKYGIIIYAIFLFLRLSYFYFKFFFLILLNNWLESLLFFYHIYRCINKIYIHYKNKVL